MWKRYLGAVLNGSKTELKGHAIYATHKQNRRPLDHSLLRKSEHPIDRFSINSISSNGAAVLLTDVKREQMIDGMCQIIRRMTRVAPRGDLVLADYDERELSIKLLSYLQGRDVEIE